MARSRKKVKVSPEELAVIDAMKGFMEKSNVVLEKIADSLGYDKKLSVKRSTVYPELEKLNMDDLDRFRLNNIIVVAYERVDAFFAIPDHLRQRWAEGVLEGKITF